MERVNLGAVKLTYLRNTGQLIRSFAIVKQKEIMHFAYQVERFQVMIRVLRILESKLRAHYFKKSIPDP